MNVRQHLSVLPIFGACFFMAILIVLELNWPSTISTVANTRDRYKWHMDNIVNSCAYHLLWIKRHLLYVTNTSSIDWLPLLPPNAGWVVVQKTSASDVHAGPRGMGHIWIVRTRHAMTGDEVSRGRSPGDWGCNLATYVVSFPHLVGRGNFITLMQY